jgi:hypothetical protein
MPSTCSTDMTRAPQALTRALVGAKQVWSQERSSATSRPARQTPATAREWSRSWSRRRQAPRASRRWRLAWRPGTQRLGPRRARRGGARERPARTRRRRLRQRRGRRRPRRGGGQDPPRSAWRRGACPGTPWPGSPGRAPPRPKRRTPAPARPRAPRRGQAWCHRARRRRQSPSSGAATGSTCPAHIPSASRVHRVWVWGAASASPPSLHLSPLWVRDFGGSGS